MAETNIDFSNMTAVDELGEVNSAIHAILAGAQSYKIGSRSVVRAELSLLLARKKELQAEVAAEGNSSLLDNTYVAVFEEPR